MLEFIFEPFFWIVLQWSYANPALFARVFFSFFFSRTTNYKMVTNVNIIVLHKMWSINKLEDDEIRVDLVNICFQKNILSIFE